MVYWRALPVLAPVLFAPLLFSQISFPGQYPGSQYPGQGRNSRGGGQNPGQPSSQTTTTREEQARTASIAGILRRISSTDMVVEADDKRVLTIAIAPATRFSRGIGISGRLSDFQPGDHLSVDTTQDDSGNYRARMITQVKKGTAEERAAASEPVDTSPIADSGTRSDNGVTNGDDDRPRLRRSSSDSDESAKAEITPRPPTRAIRPQISDGDSSVPAASARAIPDAPVPPDPNDSGPPKLRRGIPARKAADSPPLVAQNDSSPARPSIHAEEVNGVTRLPGGPRIDTGDGSERASILSSGDPVIDNAREAASSFSETLPNYVVKQFTTRYQTEAAKKGETSWHAIDTVSADVLSEEGKETYKNIQVNGKTPKEAPEKTGSWSTGEYMSVMLDVLSPATDADFHNKRSTTIVSRAAFRYDFSVAQPNSHWHVYSGAESYKPEYTGAIWIDKENWRVLRIELSARNMPRAFPLDTVESAVDYDYVRLGDGKFLLPVHSEALSCNRGTSSCSRNVIDFRNYRRYGADTSITFDSPDK